MAKKTKNTYVQNSEPVTNSDRVQGLVAKCDNLQFEVQNQHLKNVDIKSMIRNIRGQQVMLDYDLAKLYGVTTGRLNEQVKRNIERFPDDFMFQLTKGELELLKSQIVISKSAENQHDNVLISQFATSKLIERRGGRQKPPYAFTRNGIGMLSSVLRSETAVGVNILIMRAFTAIPQIVNQHTQMVQRIFNIEQHQMETDERIELILDKIEEIAPKQLPEQIFRTGCVEKNHDRFLIIDDKVYLMGASLKDMGAGLCAVTEMQASPDAILSLLK